mmetsp:Transcript_20099/g.32186  ORF Transcript_20099/g.32186 Transcript_20099/m.32186 type:complete len:234 (-) Transcript_20099:436-1137(-)
MVYPPAFPNVSSVTFLTPLPSSLFFRVTFLIGNLRHSLVIISIRDSLFLLINRSPFLRLPHFSKLVFSSFILGSLYLLPASSIIKSQPVLFYLSFLCFLFLSNEIQFTLLYIENQGCSISVRHFCCQMCFMCLFGVELLILSAYACLRFCSRGSRLRLVVHCLGLLHLRARNCERFDPTIALQYDTVFKKLEDSKTGDSVLLAYCILNPEMMHAASTSSSHIVYAVTAVKLLP